MSRLTISEAIEHCNEKIDCSECGQQHAQLAEWLEELQRYKALEEQGRLIEVVKCKDCTRCWKDTIYNRLICEGHIVQPNDYCSYAKLKELKSLPVLHGNTLPNSKEKAMKRLGLESNELKELEGDKDGR